MQAITGGSGAQDLVLLRRRACTRARVARVCACGASECVWREREDRSGLSGAISGGRNGFGGATDRSCACVRAYVLTVVSC